MEKVVAMLNGGMGYNKFWGSFNTGALSFSHTEGGRKKLPPFTRQGSTKRFTQSWGWGPWTWKQKSNLTVRHLNSPTIHSLTIFWCNHSFSSIFVFTSSTIQMTTPTGHFLTLINIKININSGQCCYDYGIF